MKNLVIFGLFLATVILSESAPLAGGIVNYQNTRKKNGEYDFYYETIDGTKRAETGTLTFVNGVQVLIVEGWYSYIGADGREYMVNFISNQNGYMPSGTHIPEGGFPSRPDLPPQPLPPNIAISLAG